MTAHFGIDFNIDSTDLEDDDESLTSESENENEIVENNSEVIKTFPLENLPLELVYVIIEKLDTNSFINCLVVNRRLNSIARRIANADKSGLRWKSIHNSYLGEEKFGVKSHDLSYKELFANTLRWNLDFSVSLKFTYWVQHIKKVNIYKDNIIVINYDGVKYFDMHTHNIKKQLEISECYDFVERDAFVLRGTKPFDWQSSQSKLFLYGKSKPTDDGFEKLVQTVTVDVDPEMNNENTVLLADVLHYVIENNTCYVMDVSKLMAYIWKDNVWKIRNMGRFYGNRYDEICAMNVHNSEIFLMTRWGKLITYSFETRNFLEVSRICMPNTKKVSVELVHRYSVVFGVPKDSSFVVTRVRKNDGYNFYMMECPDLACVTQHGELLLLGFRCGMIQMFMPKAPSRHHMLKRRIFINDFEPQPLEPEDLIVVSIEVLEDTEHHYIFIATQSAVYQLAVKHTDEACIWDNIPERPVYNKYSNKY